MSEALLLAGMWLLFLGVGAFVVLCLAAIVKVCLRILKS